MGFFDKNRVLCSFFTLVSFDSYSSDFNLKHYEQDPLFSSAPIPEQTFYPSGHLRKSRWPNGEVFYRFEPDHFRQDEIDIITDSMKKIEKVAKIKFIEESDTKKYYVKIMKFDPNTDKDYHCQSAIGKDNYSQFKTDYRQILTLGSNCIYRQEYIYRGEYNDYEINNVPNYHSILHELMHVLGLDHEQGRFDRDDHILYLSENYAFDSSDQNIHQYQIENLFNFKKSEDSFSSSVTDYDFNSIMQYHPYTGSKAGLPVILPKKCKSLYDSSPNSFLQHNLNNLNGCNELKQMVLSFDRLSRLDICTLQFMYGEPQGVPNPVNCSDVLRRVSGVIEVAQSSGEKKVSEDKLLSKRSPPKSDSNKQSKVNKSLFTEGDEFDIENCKRSKKFSSDWKTYQEGDVLSYYQYLSEEVGSCKQEIHSYTYNKVTNSWSDFPSKKTIDLN